MRNTVHSLTVGSLSGIRLISASTKSTIFEIGRLYSVCVDVCTTTLRTFWSPPILTLTTRPRRQSLRWVASSFSNTTSLTAKFYLGWVHFLLDCRDWRYSPTRPELIDKVLHSSPSSLTVNVSLSECSWWCHHNLGLRRQQLIWGQRH